MEQTLNQEQIISFPLKAYVNRYKITNTGKILSNRTKSHLKTQKRKGYNIVYVNKPKQTDREYFRVDILVATAFLGKSDKYLQHLDDDNYNDKLDNLKWIDILEYLENKYAGTWKQLEDFPKYYISNKGFVWSSYSDDLIKQIVTSGYLSVMIGYPKSKFNHIHRLVAKTFCIQDNINRNIVNHKDSDKFNNNSNNLEWCTSSENRIHGINNKSKNTKSNSFKYQHEGLDLDLGIELKKNPNYRICRSGHIYSNNTSQYMTETINDNGYCRVGLTINSKYKKYYVHRLIAEALLDKPLPTQTQVNHKNMNRQDNRIENLEWCSQSENIKHSNKNNPKQYAHLQKKVTQIDIDTDNIIKIHDGIKIAGRDTNTNSGSIVRVCKGIVPTAGGYKWKYYTD